MSFLNFAPPVKFIVSDFSLKLFIYMQRVFRGKRALASPPGNGIFKGLY